MKLLALWNKSIKRFDDIIRLLVCVLIWGILTIPIKMERGIVSTIAWFGCFFVGSAWAGHVASRLRGAGLPRWYVFLFVCAPIFLFIFLVQFRVISGVFAVLLFVLTQMPIASLRRTATASGPTLDPPLK